MSRGSVGAFLDRDGTIIHDANYIRDPNDVVLLPGAAAAIARLNRAGVIVVVVTNQSGIARGWLSTDDYDSVRQRIDDLLAAEGARIDATYVCPHLPEITGPCDCRKPALKLFRDAIADFGIDPGASVFIGDRWRDIAPAGRSAAARSFSTWRRRRRGGSPARSRRRTGGRAFTRRGGGPLSRRASRAVGRAIESAR